MDKSKIMIFTAMIVMMALGMTLTIFLAFQTGGEKEEPRLPKETKEEINTKKPSSSEGAEEGDDIVEMPDGSESPNKQDDVKEEGEQRKAEDIYQKPKKRNTEIISDRDANLYITTARGHFQKFEFLKGSEYLYEATRKYDDIDGGKTLHTLYEDGSLLSNIAHSHGDEHSDEGLVGEVDGMLVILEGIRDPEMALLGTLSLDLKARNIILPVMDSLNPVFEGNVQIMEKTPVNPGEYGNFAYGKDIKVLHRINFHLEGYALYALVVENPQGFSRLYAIYEQEKGSTNYLTVAKWNELFKGTTPKQTTVPDTKEVETKKDEPSNKEVKNEEGGKG